MGVIGLRGELCREHCASSLLQMVNAAAAAPRVAKYAVRADCVAVALRTAAQNRNAAAEHSRSSNVATEEAE